MATKLEVTERDIADRAKQAGLPPGYSGRTEREIRKELAREKTYAAISELPGSRYKEIMLFMLNEGLV